MHEEDSHRLSLVEQNFARMETSIEGMANAIRRLADSVGDYQVMADRTLRNSENIIELREQMAHNQIASAETCAITTANNTNALNAFRKELEEMDVKFDKRGDSRLKWGLGLAVTINFASISLVTTIMYILFNSTSATNTDIVADVREVKEIVLINREHIKNTESKLMDIKEEYAHEHLREAGK